MNKLFFCILLLFTIFICSSCFESSISAKRKIVWSIIDTIAQKYKKEYGLSFSGVVEASPKGKYQNLGMYYTVNHVVSKQEARQMLVELQKDFLESINNNIELQEYLLVHPFTGNNIVITVIVRNEKGYETFYPDIGSYTVYNEKLEYNYFTRNELGRLDERLEETETLEEAMESLRGES